MLLSPGFRQHDAFQAQPVAYGAPQVIPGHTVGRVPDARAHQIGDVAEAARLGSRDLHCHGLTPARADPATALLLKGLFSRPLNARTTA